MMAGVVVKLLAVVVVVYLVLLAALVVLQRRMMYFPSPEHGPAAAFGLDDTETLSLTASDGATLEAWYRPAAAGRPLFLYLHGNSGSLATRSDYLRALSAGGYGFLAIDYRGFGGSTGTPSEAGFMRDGAAAYERVRALGYAPARIVILGESLGTGVAVDVAANHPARALVLDSAYSSTADVAAGRYWMFPVHLLMWDSFDARARIGRVAVPKLFLHGVADAITPLVYDRRLYDAAKPPKTFIELPGGHGVLWRTEGMARMKTWLAALPLPL